MSEVDELRRQLAWANGQLMARDRADAEARINAMAEQQKQQDDSADTEAALQAEIERTRRGAWVNALLKNAVATNPDARFDPIAFEKSIPVTGWPPGASQSDFHFAGEHILGREADDVGSTTLGKILAELEGRTLRVHCR
jgi:hypothetical protein